jgi:hypothetical protein
VADRQPDHHLLHARGLTTTCCTWPAEIVVSPHLTGDAASQAQQLQQWKDLFAAANSSSIDAASGTIRVPLAKPTKGWMDYLLMVPGWQLVRGNMGGVTLMKRAE